MPDSKPKFIGIVAYKGHLSWAKLTEDDRNATDDEWMGQVKDAIFPPQFERGENSWLRAPPAVFPVADLEDCKLRRGAVKNPAPQTDVYSGRRRSTYTRAVSRRT